MKKDLQKLLDVSDTLVAFVRGVICNDVCSLAIPADFDWQSLYILSERHKLCALTWRGISRSGYPVPEPLASKWRIRAEQALSKEIRFDYELSQIFDAFNRAGISFILLKGKLLRDFWPGKGLREFSDHDILIKPDDHARAKEVMLELGYENEYFYGVHDVYRKKPIYNVELHVSLFEECYSFSTYFETIWDRVVPDDQYEMGYRMQPTDFYLYIVFHFLKHSQATGAGLRFFIDFYLLQNSGMLSETDKAYVRKKICEFGQFERYSFLDSVARSLFEGIGESPKSFQEFIFSGGAYGGPDWRIKNQIIKMGRGKYIVSRLFPNYATMCRIYKILHKAPFLLPFTWMARWFHHLFHSKHRKNLLTEWRGVRKF